MLEKERVEELREQGRAIRPATLGDRDLGPLRHLPGTWRNLPSLPGRGWNLIALPFSTEPGSPLNYRLLLNQFNEELKFSLVDKGVPNRGISRNGLSVDTDQFLVALDYEQMITQVAADDSPRSGKAGGPGLPIHHEPGLWLHMTNEVTDDLDIARLATVPHGDSLLALGRSTERDGPPTIPVISGLPIGADPDLNTPYLAPYKHFHDNPFRGLFDPTAPNDLLRVANQGVPIVRTTTLEVDTTLLSGGIRNIPFVVRQADATAMKATFWIQELEDLDENGEPKLRLQYSQVVLLDFFGNRRGAPGRIRWPHISINTLEKVSGPDTERAALPSAEQDT